MGQAIDLGCESSSPTDGRGRRALKLALADGLKAALESGDDEAARIALEALMALVGRSQG